MPLQSALPAPYGEIAMEGTSPSSLEGIGERTDDVGTTNISLRDLIRNVRGVWDTNPNIDKTALTAPYRMGEAHSAQYGTGGGGGGP